MNTFAGLASWSRASGLHNERCQATHLAGSSLPISGVERIQFEKVNRSNHDENQNLPLLLDIHSVEITDKI
jgi:hypothetical protein